MALAYQSHGTGSGTTSATLNIGTIAADTRVFVWGVNGRNDSTNPAAGSLTGGSLSWQAINDQADLGGSYRVRSSAWYVDVVSPTAITLNFNGGAGTDRTGVCAVSFTGHLVATPTASEIENNNSNPTPTFSQPPAGAYTLGFAGGLNSSAGQNFTADGNATSLFSSALGGGDPYVQIAAQIRTSGSYTSLGWGSAISGAHAVAIIVEAAPTGFVLPRSRMGTRWMTSKRF